MILLVLLGPGTARAVTRRRRWRLIGDPVRAPDAAWAELRDTAIDLHVPWDDGLTPRQIGSLVDATLRPDEDTRAAMERLARCEEHARYAPNRPSGDADLRYDVTLVRAAALARRSGPQRLVALAMPRSTLLVLRATVARLGSVLDWFSAIAGRVRRTVRPAGWHRPGTMPANARP